MMAALLAQVKALISMGVTANEAAKVVYEKGNGKCKMDSENSM
jgi:hypothetical protein